MHPAAAAQCRIDRLTHSCPMATFYCPGAVKTPSGMSTSFPNTLIARNWNIVMALIHTCLYIVCALCCMLLQTNTQQSMCRRMQVNAVTDPKTTNRKAFHHIAPNCKRNAVVLLCYSKQLPKEALPVSPHCPKVQQECVSFCCSHQAPQIRNSRKPIINRRGCQSIPWAVFGNRCLRFMGLISM